MAIDSRANREVMLLRLAQGKSIQDIAHEFNTTEQYIKNIMRGVRRRLGAVNTVNAVFIALQRGLIKFPE